MSTWVGTAQGGVPVQVITYTRWDLTEAFQLSPQWPNSCYLNHSLHCRQTTTNGNGLVCASRCFRWPSGKAVWLWYSLTMTQHCMHERHNNDGCLELTTIGSSIQQTTGTWIRGCVCLPARRLDSSSNPCLSRISAVLVCTSGDLPLWILTTSPGSYSPLHSSLVIRSACCSSTRTGRERRGQTERTLTHQHPRDREYNYHRQAHIWEGPAGQPSMNMCQVYHSVLCAHIYNTTTVNNHSTTI